MRSQYLDTLIDPIPTDLRGLDVAYRRLKKRNQVRSFAHRQDKPPLTTDTLAELLATLTDETLDSSLKTKSAALSTSATINREGS